MKNVIPCMLMIAALLFPSIADGADQVFGATGLNKSLSESGEGGVRDAVQDSTGRVWALRNLSAPSLSWWDISTRGWRALALTEAGLVEADPGRAPYDPSKHPEGEPLPLFVYIHPTILSRGMNGAVYCLWYGGFDGPNMVSRHLGMASHIVCHTPAKVRDVELGYHPMGHEKTIFFFADSMGNVWLNPINHTLSRITPDGSYKELYKLPVINKLKMVGDLPEPFPVIDTIPMPSAAIEDARRRVIFYFPCPADLLLRVEGLVVYDNGKFQHIPILEGLAGSGPLPSEPQEPWGIAGLEPRDAQSLWLVPFKGPLCTVDLDTFAVTPVVEPEPDALHDVRFISKTGDSWIAGTGEACWRLLNDTWEKIPGALGAPGSKNTRANRNHGEYEYEVSPVARTAHGDVIALGDAGLALAAPSNEPALMIDWRSGYPLHFTMEVFALNPEQILLTSPEGALQVGAASLTAPPSTNPLPESLPIVKMAQTADQRIWAIFADKDQRWDNTLRVWDGYVWTSFTAPAGVSPSGLPSLRRDVNDRLWMHANFGFHSEAPLLVFDSATSAWSEFPTYKAGLEAFRDAPRGYLFNDHPLHAMPDPMEIDSLNYSNIPFMSGDGRVIFLNDTSAKYFNGESWEDTPLNSSNPDDYIQRRGVYFTESGKIAVIIRMEGQTIQYESWVMNDSGCLEPTTVEKIIWPADVLRHSAGRDNADNPFGPDRHAVTDNAGAWWTCERTRKLERWADGKITPGLPADWSNPFMVRGVADAFRDIAGNTLILTGSEAFFAPPPGGNTGAA